MGPEPQRLAVTAAQDTPTSEVRHGGALHRRNVTPAMGPDGQRFARPARSARRLASPARLAPAL